MLNAWRQRLWSKPAPSGLETELERLLKLMRVPNRYLFMPAIPTGQETCFRLGEHLECRHRHQSLPVFENEILIVHDKSRGFMFSILWLGGQDFSVANEQTGVQTTVFTPRELKLLGDILKYTRERIGYAVAL